MMPRFFKINIIYVVPVLFFMSIQMSYADVMNVPDANTVAHWTFDEMVGERLTHGGRV